MLVDPFASSLDALLHPDYCLPSNLIRQKGTDSKITRSGVRPMNALKRNRDSVVQSAVLVLGMSLMMANVAFSQADRKSSEIATPVKPVSTPEGLTRPLNYKPPVRGAPSGRVGGGTRGANPGRSVVLSVLTPDHVGLTTKEQPTLYWYISQPTNYVIELTVIESKVAKPLLETQISAPAREGIQKIRLADYNLRLATGSQYRWYIALVPDPKNRSKDILAGGFIERIDPSETLRAKLAQGSAADSAITYAAEGFWYDSLEAISELIDASGGDRNLLAQRASLLDQVKLQQVAEFDRGGER
jgi:hypothetical protein